MRSIFSSCSEVLKKYKWKITIYIFFSMMLGLQALAIPYITGNFIDCLNSSTNIDGVYRYCKIFLAVSLIGILGGYLNNRLNIYIQTKMSYDLNKSVIEHVQKVDMFYLKRENMAEVNQKVNNDSNTLTSFCISVVQGIISNLVTVVVAVFVMIRLEKKVLLIASICIPIYFLSYVFLRKLLFDAGRKLKEAQTVFFGKLYEQVSYIKQLKITGMVNSFSERLDGFFPRLLKSAFHYQDMSYIFSSVDVIVVSLAQVGLFLYCGYGVINKSMTIGQFTLISSFFSMYVGAVRFFFSLGKNVKDVQICENRLRAIMGLECEANGERKLSSIENVELKDVTLLAGNKVLFRNMNQYLEKGKIYVVEGDNGGGKSSLALALIGMNNSGRSGNIRINDTDIQNIDMYEARSSLIAYMEQEPILFDDTMLFNVTLGKEYDDKKLKSLAESFNFAEFIEKRKDGWNSSTGGRETALSGGEKQKLMLIRTFLQNPQLVVLDEPSSALDRAAIETLLKYLEGTKKDRITIIITHEKDFSKIADKVISI